MKSYIFDFMRNVQQGRNATKNTQINFSILDESVVSQILQKCCKYWFQRFKKAGDFDNSD